MSEIVPKRVPSLEEIRALEDAMRMDPNVMLPLKDGSHPFIPVTHRWADHMYSREMFLQAGIRLVGKMHKHSHFFVLLEGEMTAWTDGGMERVKAPWQTITQRGTKRVIFAHTDCRFVTFHHCETKNVEELDNELIVNTDRELEYVHVQRLSRDV